MNVLHCTPGQSINHYIGGGSFLLSSCLVNSLLSLQSLNLVLQYLRYHVETYAIEMLCTVKDYTFMAPEMRKPLKQFLLVGLAINLVRPFKIFIFTKMYVRLSKFILEFFFPKPYSRVWSKSREHDSWISCQCLLCFPANPPPQTQTAVAFAWISAQTGCLHSEVLLLPQICRALVLALLPEGLLMCAR